MDTERNDVKYVFVLTFKLTGTKHKLIGENEEISINHVYSYYTTEPIMTLSAFEEVMKQVVIETEKNGIHDVSKPILVNSFRLIDDEWLLQTGKKPRCCYTSWFLLFPLSFLILYLLHQLWYVHLLIVVQ